MRRFEYVRAAAGARIGDFDIESSPYFVAVIDHRRHRGRVRAHGAEDGHGTSRSCATTPTCSSGPQDAIVETLQERREALRRQLHHRPAVAGREICARRGAFDGNVTTERRHMAKRSRFSEYQNSYANYKFELTDDGILFMQCHTDGDSLVWSWQAHDEMSDAFADIAGDREIKVLIHTGTGENYNANWGRMPNGEPRRDARLPADAGHSRAAQARREGLVCPSSHLQRARRRRADDQRRQRPVQHALRGAR